MNIFSFYSGIFGHYIDIYLENEAITEEMVREKISQVEDNEEIYDIHEAVNMLQDILPEEWEWDRIIIFDPH